MSVKDYSKQRELIAACGDPAKLRIFMKNAKRQRTDEIHELAYHRLLAILPLEQSGEVGTVPYEIWRSIHALEDVLTREQGKTARLSRTRQAIGRKGEMRTLIDLIRKPKPSEGFCMLLERDMMEYSFEAIVLRYPDHFDAEVEEAARERLMNAGVDPAKLPRTGAD